MIPRHLVIAIVVMLIAVVVMSFFMWRMRGRSSVAIENNRAPVAPPVSGPTEQVTLYVAYDDPGVLRAQSARIPLPSGRQQRGEELLRALVKIYEDAGSPHVLGTGSEVRDLYLVEPDLAVIDLNDAFADGHRSGVLVEELSVASLAETLATNLPGITRIRFLVDGKERDTLAGHADLSAIYDTAAVNQLVSQLQAGE